MSEQPLRIERRAAGIYPVLFHAGPYYWPVSDEALTRLAAQASADPEAFRAALMDAFAVTPYLKHQLAAVLAAVDDRDAQLRALQTALQTR
ncbi:MAG: hypothetical protein ACOYXU_05425 [Nitrospirota bacterium]